ncbi:CAP domain-containing protein [Georgenia wutianyii]|uniref:CAP domain-containing protein n=1 Tax=Georgenia wutianyii TaxID=2585135 RepID=A0ABX5VL01_9MICO|nr:CAP domain-containing protein [Georgenia wutianyii]QDB78538.1 CAP domain-containing protein [Georgenia wutianyii]
MTSPRSHRASTSVHALARPFQLLLRSRARVCPALQRRYRAALAGGLALTLTAAVSAAAVVEDDTASARTALAPISLEASADATAPGITVPEETDLVLSELDVDVELGKSEVEDLREAQAASRAAERQALEEVAAAETQAEQQAAAEEAPVAEEAPAAREAPAPVAAAEAGEQGALAAMVNDLRAQNGLGALARDAGLDSVAQGWAEWMAANQVLQHNPNYKSQIGAGWARSGENIVRNTGAAGWAPGEITSWMFNWWASSAPHRANMLGAEYTHVGVGYAMGAGGPYAVLVFGG